MAGAYTIPAPVGGWNARDAVEAMEATDAIELINWIPQAGNVVGRGGSRIECTIGTDPIVTLIPYDSDTGSAFLAATSGNIYDVTDFNAPVSLVSHLFSDAWQFAAFDNHLVLVNGIDAAQVYDGSSITAATITGVDPTTLIGVVNFKGRAFYWQANSTSFFYADPGAFQGGLTEFPLAMFAQRGGHIVQIITWTRDSGDGVDDYCAIIFSTGEIIVYQGDLPENSLRWSMVGRFFMGAPLGVRAHARFASTEILLTMDGILGLDEAIQNARSEVIDTFGGKIVRAAQKAAATYRNNFGWQPIYYAAGNLFIVNVPLSSTVSEQFVKNTNTQAWCKFTGWNAQCFALYGDRLYFGDASGNIWLADLSSKDSNIAYSDDGQSIYHSCITAYQTFGEPGKKTQLTAARVVTNAFDGRALSLNAFADFRTKPLPALIDPVEQTQGQWDVSAWDEDYWAGDENDPENGDARPILRPVNAFGFATALSIRYRTLVQKIVWYATTFIFKQGGVN